MTLLLTKSYTQNSANRPSSTHDLLPSERAFVVAMQQLSFGRFPFLRIERGEFVLTPWPTGLHTVKFGAKGDRPELPDGEFQLKTQVAELFEYVRTVDIGEIRALEVKCGLPFSMEVECRRELTGGRRDA